MKAMIKGSTVTLFEKVKIGTDGFNRDLFDYVPVEVENVLIAPVSADDVVDQTRLYGKKAVYTLGIPKDDKHAWEDAIVEFWGKKWKVFGVPLQGIEGLIPLEWNKKVMVERYG